MTSWNIAAYAASTSCVTITPDLSPSYVEDDALPVQRSMANLVSMPDGKILCLNGAKTGSTSYETLHLAQVLHLQVPPGMAMILGQLGIPMRIIQLSCLLSTIQWLRKGKSGQVKVSRPVRCRGCTIALRHCYPMVCQSQL